MTETIKIINVETNAGESITSLTSCEDQIDARFYDRYLEFEKAFKDQVFLPNDFFEQIGLGVDLIEKEEFGHDDHFIRYQLSWGGPSDEFRFWKNGKISYHFMDWYDHAEKDITDMLRQDPVLHRFVNQFKNIYKGLFQDLQYLD